MTPPSDSSTSKPRPSWKATLAAINVADPGHPLQIALRTYSLCLSLVLGPVLIPAAFALVVRHKNFRTRARVVWHALIRQLRPTEFAPAMTVAVGGGAALQRLWNTLERQLEHTYHPHWICCTNSTLSLWQKTFLANTVSSTLAIIILRCKRYRRLGTSPTLDLSLLFFVRALDASVQAFLFRKGREIAARRAQTQAHSRSDGVSVTLDTMLFDKQFEDFSKEWKNEITMQLDALVFWASSARVMWCFFYQPQRLPPSFVKWISSLANVDKRLLGVLRGLREGSWSYIRGSSTTRDIAVPLAEELGRPPSWGDPTTLPAYGGSFANKAWTRLGVDGRVGIGGMPCELVHGGIGTTFGLENSCVANAAIRAVYAFAQALVLHLPVQFLPILLTKPSSILRPHRALSAVLSAIRSAAFLSTFVSSYWFSVCVTRTLALARFFPNISHDVWDGPYGGTLVGSLVCGTSIWIENARRRREVALYVLPKALSSWMPEKWLRSGHPAAELAECLTFILSLASLLTFSVHQPDSLRGLSRWTLAYIMKGTNAGFWKKRRREMATLPPTPVDLSIPQVPSSDFGRRGN